MAITSRNPLLTDMTQLGISRDDTRVGNIFTGGQLGAGINTPVLDAATPVVFPPTQIVVLHTPSMFAGMPHVGQAIKSLMECHAKNVSGIDFGQTISTDGVPVGHDGQQLEVPLDNKRSQVTPSFTFQEYTGCPVWFTHKYWQDCIQHPDSNVSRAGNAAMISSGGNRRPRLVSDYSVAFLAIQPDVSYLPENINNAACYINVYPTDIGQFGYERNIGTSKLVERTITYTALVLDSDTVREAARMIWGTLRLANIDFMRRAIPYTAVNSALQQTGLAQEVQDALRQN